MIKFIQRTMNINLIKSILTTDNTYDGLVYDGSPPLQDFIPDVKNNVWFVLYEGDQIAGLITLEYLNYVLWVPHIFIFEQYRGGNSYQWGVQVAQYMIQKCGAKKFLAMTPYKQARRYAEKMGFRHIGVLTKSIKKNGVLLDQYMLELGE